MSDQAGFLSSPLRTNVCDDSCATCRFLSGDQSPATLLDVISLLDRQLASEEAHASRLAITLATILQAPVDGDLASRIVGYLNELVRLDTPAVAALIANRVPCNDGLANHPTCQVLSQHGGFLVGMLGVLNGLCGIDSQGNGPIRAVFEERNGEFAALSRFEIGAEE